MKISALILAIASLTILMGMSECGPCPARYSFAMPSGNYSLLEMIEQRPPLEGAAPFPHIGSSDMRLSVDRDQKTAIIEYTKEGKTVIETWRW
jgi:hypothetical protein